MNREARMRLKAEADRRREEGSHVVAQAPPVMSMAEAVLAAPKRTAEKPPKPAKDAAPPVPMLATDAFAIDPAVLDPCCVCNGIHQPDQLVQQTKRGRWRHVTCPARPAKPKPQDKAGQYDYRMGKQGRLPHAANFNVSFNEPDQMWRGWLALENGTTFHGESSGLFKLLTKLDQAFRRHPVAAVETVAPIA